jgi:O-antigen/teichoic acid export membrane protein
LKQVNFLFSAVNSGLNLFVVLVLGRLVPVADYAAFGAGIVYGGLLVVFVAFGNDTLLARRCLEQPQSASVASIARGVLVLAFALCLAVAFPLSTVVGGVYLASTALQQRFYFEARERQGTFNVLGLAEKILMLAAVFVLTRQYPDDSDYVFWMLLFVRLGGGLLLSSWVISREGLPGTRAGYVAAVGEQLGNGAAFTLQFALMQAAAIVLTRIEPESSLAAFTATSQIGAGLLAVVTQFQRPRIFRYLSGEAAIRREVGLSLAVTVGALGAVLAAKGVISTVFPLVDWMLLAVFALQAVVFSLIHPFELRAFATGNVPAWTLLTSAVIAGSASLAAAGYVGFSAVPVGAMLGQILVFCLCRMWVATAASRQAMR